MNVFTKSNLRKEIFTKSLAVKSCSNLNRTTKYRLSEGNGHVSKPATDELEYGDRTMDKPSKIATQRPSMHTVRSLRSDRAKLGRYVANEHAHCSVAMPSSCSSRRDKAVDTNRAEIGARTSPHAPPEDRPSRACETHTPPSPPSPRRSRRRRPLPPSSAVAAGKPPPPSSAVAASQLSGETDEQE
uniref:Uncharacterized protein n=1 Tax=Brassica oleracea var. oleracea TaxID=109376 RepID=A0A0D2ZPD0_BRAOL